MSDELAGSEQQSGGGDAADGADARPWWKKKRFIIPIALVLVVAALSGVDEDDEEELAAQDEEGGASEEEDESDGEESDEPDDAGAGAEADEETESADDQEAEPEDEPDEEEPEPEPADFDPVTLDGSGDDVVDVPVVDDVALVATLEHTGSSNFSVQSYDEGGDRIDLLVNVIGDYQGTVPYNFQVSPAELEIDADGPWTVTISPLLDQPVLEDSADGSGDEVLLVEAEGRLAATHDGESNFVLLAWGDRRDVLVNEIGAYDGTVRLRDAIALEINADGAWTLEVE